jgi:hypothetical protein
VKSSTGRQSEGQSQERMHLNSGKTESQGHHLLKTRSFNSTAGVNAGMRPK